MPMSALCSSTSPGRLCRVPWPCTGTIPFPRLARIAAGPLFFLYLYVAFWWFIVWVVHSLDECASCESAAMLRRYRDSRAPVWRFRGYHFVAAAPTWILFQTASAVEVAFVRAGYAGAWLGLLPLALFLVVLYWVTDFHVRCGFACFRCHGTGGSGRSISFIPDRSGVSR